MFRNLFLHSDVQEYFAPTENFRIVNEEIFQQVVLYNTDQISGLRNIIRKGNTNPYVSVTSAPEDVIIEKSEGVWKLSNLRDYNSSHYGAPLFTSDWNVIQDHKGYIDVRSDENGTIFELCFPITREEISDKDLSIPIKVYKGDGETILVVDDVKDQREISCKMLDTLGYKTKAVSSGEEAVEYLKEHSVDLILLDMIMDPGINGRETYERVIEIHPNQKTIIASGFAETDEVKEAQRLGAGQYIKKPLTLEKMGIAVRNELKK